MFSRKKTVDVVINERGKSQCRIVWECATPIPLETGRKDSVIYDYCLILICLIYKTLATHHYCNCGWVLLASTVLLFRTLSCLRITPTK